MSIQKISSSQTYFPNFKAMLVTSKSFDRYRNLVDKNSTRIYKNQMLHAEKMFEQSHPYEYICVKLNPKAEEAFKNYQKVEEPAAEIYLAQKIDSDSFISTSKKVPLNVSNQVSVPLKIIEIAQKLLDCPY